MAVEVSQNLTQVTISSAGVAGVNGTSGTSGFSIDSGSFVTTSSFNEFTSSLELINTIDVELLELYQTTASLNSKTGSYATTGSNSFVDDQQITGSVYIDITDSDRNIYFSINGDTNTYIGTTMGNLTLFDGLGYIQLNAQNEDGSGNYGYLVLNANNDESLFFVGDSTPGRLNASINLSTSGSFNISTDNNTATLLLDDISYDAHLVSTSSFNTFTASAATLGANTFNGNQTINGSIILDNGSVIKDTVNESISFGVDAAVSGQGVQSVALGSGAGQTSQANGAVAIGGVAGNLEQGQAAVAIGLGAGTSEQGDYAIAIGNLAGSTSQAANSIVISALTDGLENTTANSLKIAPIRNASGGDGILQYNNTTKEVSYSSNISSFVGNLATTGSNTFVGNQTISGSLFTTSPNITLGTLAGANNQNTNAIAIGNSAGRNYQGIAAVSIGDNAGFTSQSAAAIAIGSTAGFENQGIYAVGIGSQAGYTNQGTQSVALGAGAGSSNQGNGATAIGSNAGSINQGQRAVAIGSLAGTNTQGEYAIAIGNFAAPNNQAPNSIVISATGTGLENATTSSLVIAPIRNASGTDGLLQYNYTTKEVSYSNEFTGSLNITGSVDIIGSGSLNGDNIVSSNTIMKIETISSASYAALNPPVSGTLYIII